LARTFSSSAGFGPTSTSTEAAMQRWPEQPAKEATMSEAELSGSQSDSATRWFLAPPRASTCFVVLVWCGDGCEGEPFPLSLHSTETVQCNEYNPATYPLVEGAGALVHDLGHARGADKGHGVDARVVDEAVDGVRAAVDDLEDSGRHAGLSQQLRDAVHRQGDLGDDGI